MQNWQTALISAAVASIATYAATRAARPARDIGWTMYVPESELSLVDKLRLKLRLGFAPPTPGAGHAFVDTHERSDSSRVDMRQRLIDAGLTPAEARDVTERVDWAKVLKKQLNDWETYSPTEFRLKASENLFTDAEVTAATAGFDWSNCASERKTEYAFTLMTSDEVHTTLTRLGFPAAAVELAVEHNDNDDD